MYTVEYISPYSNEVVTKKFKGRRGDAHANAHFYASERYRNYYMTVTVSGYETMGGKRTGRSFTHKGTGKPWFE